jgi:hypothetical protein
MPNVYRLETGCPLVDAIRERRLNPFKKFSQEQLTWATVTSTMQMAARFCRSARCGAGADFSALKKQFLPNLHRLEAKRLRVDAIRE